MQELVDKIILELKLDPTLPLKRRIRGLPGYTTSEFILSLISTTNVEEASKVLGYTSSGPIKQSIREVLLPIFPDRHRKFGEGIGGRSWRYELLATIGHRKCWNCNNVFPYSKFYKDSTDPFGISSECSSCHSYRTKLAKIDISNRTPNWASLEDIRKVYNNCPEGMHVDHVIPLRGKDVSGLHVAQNLQYLSPRDNLEKSNTYIIT